MAQGGEGAQMTGMLHNRQQHDWKRKTGLGRKENSVRRNEFMSRITF
jgi:hypothetical protein